MRPKLLLISAFKAVSRSASSSTSVKAPTDKFRFSSGFESALAAKFSSSFLVHENFVTEEEEAALMSEVEPHLGRLVYEKDHWDEVRSFCRFRLLALVIKYFNVVLVCPIRPGNNFNITCGCRYLLLALLRLRTLLDLVCSWQKTCFEKTNPWDMGNAIAKSQRKQGKRKCKKFLHVQGSAKEWFLGCVNPSS